MRGQTVRLLTVFLFLSFSSQVLAESYRVVVLQSLAIPSNEKRAELFASNLKQIVANQNVELTIETYNMLTDKKRGRSLIRQHVIERPADLLVTVATLATELAWQERESLLSDTDVMFFFVSDPIGIGITESIGSQSGYRFTGQTHITDRKFKMALVKSLLDQASGRNRVLLLNSSYPASRSDAGWLMRLSEQSGDAIDFVSLELPFVNDKSSEQYLADFDLAVRQNNLEFDYIWITRGPMGQKAGFVEGLLERYPGRLAYAETLQSVESGALISVTSGAGIDANSAAKMAASILKKKSAAGFPVSRVDRFLLGVNLTTAEALNIDVPNNILRMARDNVFR